MTPAAFWLVIVKRARLAAFRTGPLQPVLMPQVHMHLSVAQLQLDAFHAPRFSNPQNLGVQISILHLPIICLCPLYSQMSQDYQVIFVAAFVE
jgi:hypothetical protein